MNLKKTLPILFAMALITLIGFSGCSSTGNSNGGHITVKMTDAPADYDEVNITINSIQVHRTEINTNEEAEEDSTGGWVTIMDEPVTVNLLNLANKSMTLGETDLEAGSYNQMRLVLGTDNEVVINGESHQLITPSAQQSGLKLNINADIDEGENYVLLVDFDAGRSIIVTGNGKYMLKPVLRQVEIEQTGGIEGSVEPFDFKTYVMAIGNDDTLSTYTDLDNGGFSIAGVTAGTYDVTFQPSDSTYADTTITAVEVTTGEVTELDTVTLVKTSN